MNEGNSVHLTPALSPERRGSEGAEPACVTRFELAELLHVSVRTVDRIIAAGEIPVRRVRGKAVRFLRADVEQYLKGGSKFNLPAGALTKGGAQ